MAELADALADPIKRLYAQTIAQNAVLTELLVSAVRTGAFDPAGFSALEHVVSEIGEKDEPMAKEVAGHVKKLLDRARAEPGP